MALRTGYVMPLVLALGCHASEQEPAPAKPSEPAPVAAPAPAQKTPEPKPPEHVVTDEPADREEIEASTRVGACELHLTVEGGSMWWRADRSSDATEECDVLAPSFTTAWVALAERIRQRATLPDSLSLGIAFYLDEPSIETWFRYQAAEPVLQKRLRGTHDARLNVLLAEHMLSSSALSRYQSLLDAMGLTVDRAYIEKVERRSARGFESSLPIIKSWKLPPKSMLALPFMTHLSLRPK